MVHRNRPHSASRRQFLATLPASLASLGMASPMWARLMHAAVAAPTGRQRLIVWYTPDGTVPQWFWPAEQGPLVISSDSTYDDLSGTNFSTAIPAARRPSFLLQSVASYADRMLMVRGINGTAERDHGPAVQHVLTGGGNTSLDVIMGDLYRESVHAQSVLRTGVYGNRVSYNDTRQLTRTPSQGFVQPSWQPLTDARAVLDAVGGLPNTGGEPPPPEPQLDVRGASRLAALGSVRERVAALSCAVGRDAGQRLQAYVEEVARLEALEQRVTPGDPVVVPDDVLMADPYDSDVADAISSAQRDIASLPQVTDFVIDMAVTALALNYSPAVTIQWGASGENKIQGGSLTDYRYDFIPHFEHPGAGDHALAHPMDGAFMDAGFTITGPASTRDRVRVHRWFFSKLARLLDRLSAIPDGAGTLLDRTTVLCVSEFGGPDANSSSAQHSLTNLPYLLVGGSQTPFLTGQYINLSSSRSNGDYLLTLARGFGSTATAMGDGDDVIGGIVR